MAAGRPKGETKESAFAGRIRRRRLALYPQQSDTDRARGYAHDPVAFAVEVLGLRPWSLQVRILQAALKHKRIAIVSGHKVGKSTTLAVLALWFYCSFPGVRVVITATTDRQVNGIIWREVRRLVARSRLPIPCAADISELARSGLENRADFSEIKGYTAKQAEAIAGVSGETVVYLVDEASGVAPIIFNAIEGNRAGGNAWVFLISNPTRGDGEFYDAFHKRRRTPDNPTGYETFQVPSWESPNCTGEWRELDEWRESRPGARDYAWRPRERPIPGLAVPEWIDEKRRDWGEDSALFKIRVAGSFVVAEASKAFSAALLIECHDRHDSEAPWAAEDLRARPVIGVDPAGDGDGGDSSGFAARRGGRVVSIHARAGLSAEAHIAEVQGIIEVNGWQRAGVIVNVDSEGETGWKVYSALRGYAESFPEGRQPFTVVRVRSSDKARREPMIYDRTRDELYAIARSWCRAGGSIPHNDILDADLHAADFASNLQGRLKITPKDKLRELLGRSPDLGDAFLLCCFDPVVGVLAGAAVAPTLGRAARDDDAWHDEASATFDPYGSNGFDPYG